MIQLPYRLILASGSPRRQELLKQMQLEFEIRLQQVDETYPPDLTTERIAEYLACKKAAAYKLADDELLLTADTVVVLEGEVLGKPVDADEAFRMLRQQSGKTQEVYTGVCLRTVDQSHSFSALTKVHFNHLTDEEIHFYIGHYQPFDKAGAYGIQEWLGFVGIEGIEGSYTNVMGLPTETLYAELRAFQL